MAYTPLQVNIPKPCHENWDKMTPVGNQGSRHCDSCAKQVTDFTWMTDREIDGVLRAAGNNLCGRFRPDQLRRPIRAAVLPATGWRAAVAATALLLGGGTVAERTLEPPMTGEIAPYATEQVAVNDSTFRARVVDEYGEAVAGARVTVGTDSNGVESDAEGYFSLVTTSDAQLSIYKEDYLLRTVTVLPDDAGFTETGNQYELFDESVLVGEFIAESVPPPPPPLPPVVEVMGDVEFLPKAANALPVYHARIVDEMGEPLIGAGIRIEGTTRGTVTDLDGNFYLSVEPDQTLSISYLGYESLDTIIRAGAAGFGEVTDEIALSPTSTRLDEIVVVGYGIMGKMQIMGAVSTLQESCDSKIESVHPISEQKDLVAADAPTLNVYPNPFTDRLTVSFRAGNAGAKSARLFNISGQVVQQWPAQRFEGGRAELQFPLLNTDLAPAQYILRLEDPSGEQESFIVIKR